jgi:hypothetical protein
MGLNGGEWKIRVPSKIGGDWRVAWACMEKISMQFVQVTYDNLGQKFTWPCMGFTWTSLGFKKHWRSSERAGGDRHLVSSSIGSS